VRQVPSSYVLNKFYTYAGAPKFRKFDGNYNASCPICREGKSWLKKKRLYFYPTTSSFYCFNCNRSWNALNWIISVSGLSKEEILTEMEGEDNCNEILLNNAPRKMFSGEQPHLPHDSINIEDEQQLIFYGVNPNFQDVIEYGNSRRLFTAINRCNKYYVSLTDKFHKNRLCIPYLNRDKKIIFYQTRKVSTDDSPRYLNKVGFDKSVFGIDRINVDIPYIFIFEGPLDAMFVKNGVSVAGLTTTDLQNKQLNEFPFHERIWILDNPNIDQTSKQKTVELLGRKEKVFKWPLNLPFKDFNECAVFQNKNEIELDFILDNLYIY